MNTVTRQLILEQATACVTKDRNATHGNPEDNFNTIAGLWTVYLQSKGLLAKDQKISAVDVATLMVLMKVSRVVTTPGHLDHWVDIAGYAACGGEIGERLATLQNQSIARPVFRKLMCPGDRITQFAPATVVNGGPVKNACANCGYDKEEHETVDNAT